MSLSEKNQKLENIRQQIFETEEEIKNIQIELLKKRSDISHNQMKSIRKSKSPQTVEPEFTEDLYEGLSEDNYEYLGKLKQKVTNLRNKVEKQRTLNQSIQEEIENKNKEIVKLENFTVDVKSRLFEISINNRKQKENELFQKGKKRELKTASRDYRRAAKDAEVAIMGLDIKSSVPNEDRNDYKPYMKKLSALENSIRETDKKIEQYSDEINLIKIEIEKPIIPDNDEDEEMLQHFQIADEIEPDLKRLSEEVNQKEKELSLLNQEVMKKHAKSLLIEQKYDKIKSIFDENIEYSEEVPNLTVNELLKKLDLTLSQKKDDKTELRSLLDEKISSNKDKEALIRKRVRKIEVLKVMNEREINKIKTSIKEQRDKSFDEEMDLIDKIKGILFREKRKKNKSP